MGWGEEVSPNVKKNHTKLHFFTELERESKKRHQFEKFLNSSPPIKGYERKKLNIIL